MLFIILLGIAAAALASAAEFFSVYGLAQIYAASSTAVIIMGISLGFAKLITTSFLYRFWSKTNVVIKTYLICAIAILMTITSIGTFGYLTAGYQKGNIPITEINHKIDSDKIELQRYIDRKNDIDKQVSGISTNSVRSKRLLIQTFNNEYKTLQPNIDRLTKEIDELQSQHINVEAKVGPIVYVSKVLNLNPDNALFYLTILLVIVFDPLAVTLTIATNIAIEDRRKNKQTVVKEVINSSMGDRAVTKSSQDVIFPTEPEFAQNLSSAHDLFVDKMRKEIAEES